MELKAPGLKTRKRDNGEVAYYWVPRAGNKDVSQYPTRSVRLHGDAEMIISRCGILQAELKEWLSSRGMGAAAKYDGTLRSLIRLYTGTAESPYFSVKSNTRAMYDESLAVLTETVGARKLERLTGLDFMRWYANFKEPAKDTPKKAQARADARALGIILPPNPERPRRGYKAMQLLRIVIKFGIVLNITDCFRLATVLENMEFSAPPARTEAITYEQARAICELAIKKGKFSIALSQALQFELTLRQIDVIGRWEKTDSPEDGGIVDRGRRWRDGLLWSNLDANGILSKSTSKTGQVAEHDTMAYPFLREMIDLVPIGQRFGPMIRCETTGLPYRYRHFSQTWRDIATEAGVPTDVWNRDSRAGGVTEGSDAGADIEHLRHHANHKNAQTTARYNRKTLEKTRQVAELRVAHRGGKNASET